MEPDNVMSGFSISRPLQLFRYAIRFDFKFSIVLLCPDGYRAGVRSVYGDFEIFHVDVLFIEQDFFIGIFDLYAQPAFCCHTGQRKGHGRINYKFKTIGFRIHAIGHTFDALRPVIDDGAIRHIGQSGNSGSSDSSGSSDASGTSGSFGISGS